MTRATVRLEYDDLPRLTREMKSRARAVRRKTAADIQRDWAAGVRVDTGHLKNSIQSTGHPAHVGEETADAVTVGTAVDYALHENYGTRSMSGSFAFEKAVERNRGPFEQAMRGVLAT